MLKRFLSLFLATVLLTAQLLGVSATATDVDYVEVWDIEDLYNIRYDLTKNYKLMADIDMSDETDSGYITADGWKPIGLDGYFNGIFDGNGYAIKNLPVTGMFESGYVDDDGDVICFSGLFGRSNGVIKNLNISGTIDLCSGYSGLLVAYNSGYIYNCHVSDSSVNYCRSLYMGAICGYNVGIGSTSTYGKIEACSVEDTTIVSKENSALCFVGGICGYNDGGVITECYSLANFTAENVNSTFYLGGIVGGCEGGYIYNCYNAGELEENIDKCYSYGICPKYVYYEPTIYNCYTTNGEVCFPTISPTDCYYLDNSLSSDMSLSEAQMKKAINFVGFDFDSVWVIDENVGYKYPQLRSNRQDTDKLIESVSFKSEPESIEFFTEDNFTADGIITVNYIDGATEDIQLTDDMVSGYDMNTASEQIVTVTYKGFELNYKITVKKRPTITGLTLLSEPNQNEFVVGTELDYSGAQAKASYSDGTTEIIDLNADNTTGANINESGEYLAVFLYKGYSVSFDVRVVPVKIIELTIESLPDKTDYVEDQEIDFTGMVIKAKYNNGDIKEVSDYTAEYDKVAGKQTVRISYSGVSVEFDVVFAKKVLEEIIVTNMPDKTVYYTDEVFDTRGMVVEARYNNGISYEITDYTVGAMPETSGIQSLEISYGEKSAYITITVNKRNLVSISITKKPIKTEYFAGEDFEADGMEVIANYDNSTARVIYDYEVSSVTTEIEESFVTISYGGFTEKLVIHVHDLTDWIISESCMNSFRYKMCTDCGTMFDYENLTAPGHTVTDWIIDANVTCTENGAKHKECSVCGEVVENEDIIAEGHKYLLSEYVEPTCEKKGYEKWNCTGCGENYLIYITETGHAKSDWLTDRAATCSREGSRHTECTVCGEILETVSLAKTEHSVTEWITDKKANCTDNGIKHKECIVCGEITQTTVILSTGHSESNWITDKTATCTQMGLKHKECLICTEILYTKNIEKLGHTQSIWIIDRKATCTQTGLKHKECVVCGETLDTRVINELGHTVSNWITDKKATVNSAGSKHRECTECGEILETAEIPQLKPATPKLTKVANTASGVQINWGKVSGADNYIVYRRTYNAKTKAWSGWSKLKSGVTSTSYVDKTAKSGTYYIYTVKANNEAGYGGHTSGLKTYFLSTPKLASIANASGKVTVKWNKVSGAKGYIVYRRTYNASTKTWGGWSKLGTTKSNAYNDTKAKSGTYYRYTVRAYYGDYTSYFDTTGLQTKFLATPKLSKVTSAKSGVTVKWGKVTGATGYIVYRKTGSGSWAKIATVKGNAKVSCLDKTAKKGKTYTYTVKAYSGDYRSYYNTKGLTIKDKY